MFYQGNGHWENTAYDAASNVLFGLTSITASDLKKVVLERKSEDMRCHGAAKVMLGQWNAQKAQTACFFPNRRMERLMVWTRFPLALLCYGFRQKDILRPQIFRWNWRIKSERPPAWFWGNLSDNTDSHLGITCFYYLMKRSLAHFKRHARKSWEISTLFRQTPLNAWIVSAQFSTLSKTVVGPLGRSHTSWYTYMAVKFQISMKPIWNFIWSGD